MNKEIQKQKDTIKKYQDAILSIVKNDVDTIDFMPMRRNVIYMLKGKIGMYKVFIKKLEKNNQNDSKNLNSNGDETNQYRQNIIKMSKDIIKKTTSVKNKIEWNVQEGEDQLNENEKKTEDKIQKEMKENDTKK